MARPRGNDRAWAAAVWSSLRSVAAVVCAAESGWPRGALVSGLKGQRGTATSPWSWVPLWLAWFGRRRKSKPKGSRRRLSTGKDEKIGGCFFFISKGVGFLLGDDGEMKLKRQVALGSFFF